MSEIYVGNPYIRPLIIHTGSPALANAVEATLFSHYPGWMWTVEIPSGQDVLIIRNLDLDPRGKWCMMRRVSQLDVGLHDVVIAAGEFLERAKKKRGARREDENLTVPILDKS